METINNLVKLPLPSHLNEYIELYRNPSTEDFWLDSYDSTAGWPQDVEGSGLIIYMYKAKRLWIKNSISKTPFSFLKKSLEIPNPQLTNVLIIKGTQEYPLTETETKTLSGLLVNRLKNTEVAVFTSYSSVPQLTPVKETFLNEIITVTAETLTTQGYDVSVKEPSSPTPNEVRTFTETYETNGTKISVSVKLRNEDLPEEGISYASIRLTDDKGNTIISANTGTYPDRNT